VRAAFGRLVTALAGGAALVPGLLAAAEPATPANPVPPAVRAVESADLELLEFLGGDDDLDAELDEFLARQRTDGGRERATAPTRPAPTTNGSGQR
jgi:hypothetical protein